MTRNDTVQKWRSGLQPGDLVRARGDCWRIAGLSAYVDSEAPHLDGIDATNRGLRRSLLFPFDRPVRLHRSSYLRVVRRTAWYRAFRALARDHAPHDSLQAAASARIDLLAYQLKPSLAVLRGQASRLLLADGVGLGKTIQAGLVVKELLVRGHADRTLILTPSGLRAQWARELSSRFDIGKLDVSRSILYKAAQLTEDECREMQRHVDKGISLLEPVGGLTAEESSRSSWPITTGSTDRGTTRGPASRSRSRPASSRWRTCTIR